MTSKRFRIGRKADAANTADSGESSKSKGEKVSAVTKRQPPVHMQPPAGNRPSSDPVADDLMRRVIQAIDSWIIDNHLDRLPRHIVFQQVLSILNSLSRTYSGTDAK